MERLWTKSFIQLTVSMLFLFTGFYLLLPTLPLYIIEMGGNESQVGLAAGLFTLAAVVLRPIVGGLLDRYGRRSFIIWGLLFFTLSMYLYDWVGTILMLMALRVLHGMSWAVSTTAVGTAVTDVIPPTRRGEGMGWYGIAMTVSMAIGPLLGIWIIQNFSFQNLFLFSTLLSLIALLLIFSTKMSFTRKQGAGNIQFFDRSVLSVTIAIFFLAVSYGGITTFLPLFAASLDVNPGTFFLVYAITLTAIRPVAGKLSDRHGEATVIVPALVFTFLALIVLSLSSGLIGILTSAILYGIGFGSAQPALQAVTLRLAHQDRKGVANASFFTAFDLGIAVGAIALGTVSQFAGYSMSFMVSSVSVVIAILVFVLSTRRMLTNRQTIEQE
ncbi:MFS transporter [Bacillus horti]|uniref:MFS family permease n=1 Tax=Caldalkalibacillus horti TaxID=77523 RepID=A0ABT9VU50_9BACI|nr:MFS transporter [Bacillus horti]MDQ0164514.1 MFS family permease [Bacillus horti]